MILRRGAIIIGAALLASCGQDQAFRIDERVDITAPSDRAEVRLPVTLRWRADEVPAGRSFAVFVDRAPVRPGKRVLPSVRQTDAVYTTADTKLVIEDVHDDQGEGRERHAATIVLIDASSRRVGESAWDVVFEVKRDSER